jgi:hypothetical protein
MGGWLTKAKSAFGGRRRAPVPFEVTSSAGRVVEGVRGTTHQVVICPATGEQLFVLPRDVYPPPRTAQTSSRSKGTRRRARRDGHASPERARKPAGTAPRPPREARPRRRLRDRMVRVRDGATRVRAWFTPIRTLVAVVALCLVLTTWWALHTQAIAAAEVTLRDSTSAAWAALEAGDLHAAEEAFQAVVGALDTLGRDDPALRRAAAEVHVATSLTPLGLVDVLADPNGFDQRRGGWVVVDATVFRTNDNDGGPIVVVEYPFEIDGTPLEVRADPVLFDGLELPNAADPEPFPVVFAAKLDTLTPPAGEFGYWTLTLEPNTGFLWVHDETIETVGIGPDAFRTEAELAAILDRQANADGIPR